MSDYEKRMHDVWIGLWRNASESTRFEIGMQMMRDLRKRIEIGVRDRYPDWSDDEVTFEVFRRLYKDDLSAEQMEKIRKRFFEMREKGVSG